MHALHLPRHLLGVTFLAALLTMVVMALLLLPGRLAPADSAPGAGDRGRAGPADRDPHEGPPAVRRAPGLDGRPGRGAAAGRPALSGVAPAARATAPARATPHRAAGTRPGGAPAGTPPGRTSRGQLAGTPSAAARRAAMSSLRIPSIACIARDARSRSESLNSSSIPAGTTCHDRP